MRQKIYKHLLRAFFLLLFAVGIGNSGWAQVTDYYWVGGASGTIDDGNKWSLSTGGPTIGGTITFASDATESLHFDDYSGASSITVTLNGTYSFDHITLVSNLKVTLDASSPTTITLLGVQGGGTLCEFAIAANVKVLLNGHIDGGGLYFNYESGYGQWYS